MRYRSNNIMALVPPGTGAVPVIKQTEFFQRTLGMNVFLYQINDKPSLLKELFHNRKIKTENILAANDLRNITENTVNKESLDKYTYRIKNGNKLKTLIRQSKLGGYEFMMVAKDGLQNNLEKSEIDKLVSLSSIPVMSISTEYNITGIRHIVIPVDVSQSTPKRLLWASYFAKKYDAKITLVSALNIDIGLKQSLAWRNSEKLKHMLSQRGIPSEVIVLKDTQREKSDVILEYINNTKPGLIIARTHQDVKVTNTLIGSFISNIVHGTKIPVFTVNKLFSQIPVDFEFQ